MSEISRLGPDLSGKVIVVTGSSSGIGLASARLLSRLGATVIGVDRTPGKEAVATFHQADLSESGAVDALVAALPRGIDGLANVAGLPPTRPAADVLKVNLFAVKRLTLGLIPKMNDRAAIANVISLAGNRWASSVEAIRASEDVAMDDPTEFMERFDITAEGGRSYFFSKEALVVWTMQNRWTWRDRGIRMNAVSPGPVDTPIYPDFQASLGLRASTAERVMDRHGLPEDIAPVVAFLMSDMSTWLRGANIPVDGGMAAHYLCEQHRL